jgi:spermidine/putrescine-binding protein
VDHSLTRRDFLRLGAVASTGAFLAACGTSSAPNASTAPASAPASTPAPSQPAPATSTQASVAPGASFTAGDLNFLTWSDHWSKESLSRAQTAGIKVNITELSDDADGFLKSAQVHGQLDLVSADALWVPLYHDNGLVRAMDINSIDVASELYSVAKQFPFWTTSDGYLGFPWGWSVHQIAYNPAHVSPAPDSWDVLIDPKYAKRVVMENQPTVMVQFAGSAIGAKDPTTMTDAELAQAKDWLVKLKPNILKLVSQGTETIAALADESAWLATGNLGIPDRVKDAKGPEVISILPKPQNFGFVDCWMITKEAENGDRAIPYFNIGGRADLVAQNFLDNGRPLLNEKAYKLLVDGGHQDRADRYLYNKPETINAMALVGPGRRTQDYIAMWNTVFGA